MEGVSPGATPAAIDRWLDAFFEHALTRDPVTATVLGTHTEDTRLPDYSRDADADRAAHAQALMAQLDAIPHEDHSESQRYDRILARGALQIAIWETTSPCFQAGNPAHHTSEAIGAIVSLLDGDGPVPDERTDAIVTRLRAIPAFLATARQRMNAAPLVWTELAMRQCDAAVAWFSAGFPMDGGRAEIAAARATAAAAFDEHGTWLRHSLAERRIALEPIGADAFDLHLRLGHVLPVTQTPEWWFDYAHAELADATREMRELAQAIDWRQAARVQLRALDRKRMEPASFIRDLESGWDRCRAAAVAADLVTWPDVCPQFIPIDAVSVNLWNAAGLPTLRGTPPLGPVTAAHALVPAPDPLLPFAAQSRPFQQLSETGVWLDTIIRNAGLGAFVQLATARHASSRVGQLAGTRGAHGRAFFCGNTLADGWMCYAAELMEEIGALTTLQRLAEAHRRVWVAARALGDIGFHTGELSFVRVARMLRDEAGLPATEALEASVRISMHPGAGMAELAGAAAIDELRLAIETQEGARFSLRSFHDRLLSYGAIPVTLIAASMMETA